MRTVNYFLIWDALGGLELAEIENRAPFGIDPDDEASVKSAFRKHVKPWVERWSRERIGWLKISMAYFMDREDIMDREILANLPHLQMPDPSDMRLFSRWLWECLFPNEDSETVDLSDVQEDNDVMQINKAPGELR